MSIKKRLLRTFILATIGLSIGAAIGFFQITADQSTATILKNTSRAHKTAGISIGGSFDLIDHHGKQATSKQYQNQYKLIYFGFTYCPAICPTELQKITQVLNALEKKEVEHIQPLFITIDPERDAPEILKDYVSLFHPKMIGLTGSAEQIETIKKDYRVFATKVEDDELNDYTMDHSSFIYLMNPTDELLSIYRIQDNADYIVQDIRTKISEFQAQDARSNSKS